MKKIIVSFLMLFVLAPVAFAGDNKATDAVSGRYYDHCRRRNWTSGVQIFCSFPDIRICRDTGARFSFSNCGEDHGLCPGFDLQYYIANNSVTIPNIVSALDEWNQRQVCWKWECKPGFVMDNDKKCISLAECESSANCSTASTLCDSAGFNPNKHDVVQLAGESCNTFKCKSGTCSETPATSGGQCSEASPAGKFGGIYGDAMGVCQPCPLNESVYISGTTSGCTANGVAVGRSVLGACFDSFQPKDFLECVNAAVD